ncbi:hypothetical protein H4R19_003467 [Coemansia spiralis]|nr:hypothetical protein H4R19_003467 [Coemansia spiralis]
MSQVLTKPWLSGLFETDLELGVDSYKLGRRVQMFHFARQPAAEAEAAADRGGRRGRAKDPCSVTCEISDKHNFMRAAISTRSVQAFEAAREQPIESMGGMVVAIQGFRLMLYNGDAHPPDSASSMRGQKKKKPGPPPVPCPQRIRDAGHPQFWMLITRFEYLGAEGNAIFDEPRYILSEPCVRDRLAMLLAERHDRAPPTEAKPEQQSAADDKSENQIAAHHKPEKRKAAADVASSASPSKDRMSVTPKRQRPALDSSSSPPFTPLAPLLLATPPCVFQGVSAVDSSAGSGVHWPTIEQVPFVGDAQAAWGCAALWQAVGIQRACVPHMPVHGMRYPRAEPARSSAAIIRPVLRENAAPRSPPRQLGAAPAAAATAAESPRSPRGAATLHGLLVPGDAGLVSSETMMDAMFGMIACGPEQGAEYDAGQTGADGIDAAQLLAMDID